MTADGVTTLATEIGERDLASSEFLTPVMPCPSVSMGVVDGAQEGVPQPVAGSTSAASS